MCGRFTRTSSHPVLAEEFGVTHFVNVNLSPRYNIAPSQTVETILRDGLDRRMGPMKWGLMSPSATDPKLAPTNARVETVATTPMFRDAFRRRRCLVAEEMEAHPVSTLVNSPAHDSPECVAPIG